MKKKSINDILNNIIIYVTILIFNFSYIAKVLDSDLFFDIRSAKDILTYGLDFTDHMSMFDGLKYLYHHWLYDLIIYPIFNLGSYPLVFLFILTIFFIFSIVVYNFINSHVKNKLISTIATCSLISVIGLYNLPRVQSINYLLMLLQFISIYKLYETGKIKYSIFSIILSIILVNIHFPLWILVPVFYLPYIVQMVIGYLKKKYKFKFFDNKIEIVKCKNTKVFVITTIIILFTCLASPYGFLPYVFGFKVNGLYGDIYSNIGEMHRVVLYNYKEAILCFGYFIILLLTKKKIRLSNLFYLLGLAYFGMMVARNLPYLYTYYVIIITITLFADSKFKIKDYFKKFHINKEVIKVTCIILEVIFLSMNVAAMDLKNYQYGIQDGGEPEELANYIVENLDYKNLKFYNDFNVGSYLAYREIPTFVDSRVEVYLKTFNDKEDIMYNYYYMDAPDVIDKYKFDYIITTGNSKMYGYLKEHNYEEVYSQLDYYRLFKNKEA